MMQTIKYKQGYIHLTYPSHLNGLKHEVIRVQVDAMAYSIEVKSLRSAKIMITKHGSKLNKPITIENVQGEVIWFNEAKGYGFVKARESSDPVFIHYSAILRESNEFQTLNERETITFDLVLGSKGPQAFNVKREVQS